MADQSDFEEQSAPRGADFAAHLAMDGGTSAESREYLRKQSRIADLQIEEMERENAIRHWSLRVRHISDVMKLTFELAVALIVASIVIVMAVTLIEASRDNSLVIEAFSVPPDLAARGLTGQAVAAQVQDSLSAMQAATVSARPASSYGNNWGDDIKVQIPDTGISVSEFYRLLVSWLGNQTHISGEVWRNGDQITVTARVGADAASTVTGKEADLSPLLRQAAEKIYARTQPYRYSAYLEELGPVRIPESRKVLVALAADGDRRERAWAWLGLGNIDAYSNDPHRVIAELHKAATLAPNMALAFEDLDNNESTFGHDEPALDAAKTAVQLLRGSGDVDMSDRARAIALLDQEASVAFALNDFNAAVDYSRQEQELPDYAGRVENGRETELAALAFLHDGAGERRAVRDLPPADSNAAFQRGFTEAISDYWFGNWGSVLAFDKQALQYYRKAFANFGASNEFVEESLAAQWWPYVATAKAMTGDFRGADALIARTPLDCYTCVRNRAVIAEAEKNWNTAAYWFALAVKEAPSIPLGYAQWGDMLLARGDYDGAIAKFGSANQKGPHFADPLEMWGEALIAKNHCDLALAKFEEADKYTPNWGRLHLKWGEALLWSGDKVGAQNQFSTANGLDLTAPEKSELAKMSAAHG